MMRTLSYVCVLSAFLSTAAAVTCLSHGVYIPDPDDCKVYYVCSHTTPIYQECGPELVWNPKFQLCDWPQSVPGCENYYSTGPVCPLTDSAYFPDYDNCKWYYRCYNGQRYHYECPLSLAWDVSIPGCNDPKLVAGCGLITPSTTPAPFCPLTGSAWFPDPDNCRWYYRCYNGEKYHFECGFSLVWDVSKTRCNDDPELVAGCGLNTPPPTPAPTTTTPAENITVCYQATTPAPVCAIIPPAVGDPTIAPGNNTICVTVDSGMVKRQAENDVSDFDCKTNGKFRHPKQANERMYITCQDGTARQKQCRRDRVFDPIQQKCTKSFIIMAE